MRSQGYLHARLAGLAACCALSACQDAYSHDPKVAAAYAGAAAGVAVAQAVASHTSDTGGGSTPAAPTDNLRPLRDYTLQAINRIRANHALAPLTPSVRLSDFAQQGSEWLADDHQPRRHLLSDAQCARCGENQGRPEGEPTAPAEVQIDAALRDMMKDDAEPRANLLSSSWRFVGIGIAGAPGAAMFFTLDFTDVAF